MTRRRWRRRSAPTAASGLRLSSAAEVRQGDPGRLQGRRRLHLPAADAVGCIHLRRAGEVMALPSRKHVLQLIVGTAGVAALWQLASLFFPDYLFPSIPQIVRRFVDIATTWSTQVDVLQTAGRILAGLVGAFVLGVLLALLLNKSRQHRSLSDAGADAAAGHSRAVLGGDRRHLVSRHRVPHLLHHGGDDAAGLHLPDPRRRALHVEGPVRDDGGLPARRAGPCSACWCCRPWCPAS